MDTSKLPVNRQTLRVTVTYEFPISDPATSPDKRKDISDGLLDFLENSQAAPFRTNVKTLWTIERGGQPNVNKRPTTKTTRPHAKPSRSRTAS